MIGLIDYDLQTSTSEKLIPPNLEIMKLACYYKREENKFCRLIDLNETEFTNYDKVFFFSEGDEIPKLSPAFLSAKNIIYGGTTFTNGTYVPFSNPIIDYTLPHTFIYKEYLKEKYLQGVKTKVIGHILDDTYYRCYAGESRLPLPPIIPQKRVFIYDREFFYPDWEEIIDEISDRKPSSIFRIHPIECKTLQQYFSVRAKTKISRVNEIILNINIPLDECVYLFKKYKNLFLADITDSSNVYLTLGGNLHTSFHSYKNFIYKMNLLYSFWANSIPLKVKYIEPFIGYNDPLKNLSKLVASWTRKGKYKHTLDEKMTKSKTLEKEEKELLLKFYPSSKDLFMQNYPELRRRGQWKL